MSKDETIEEIANKHKILKEDPKRYLSILSERISKDAGDPDAYFSRHMGWMAIGRPYEALADLNRAIELESNQTQFWCRGDVYRYLGEYEKASVDYATAEAIDPERWTDNAFPLLYQADVHARLGHEARALACCARLPDDFWTPGMNELPPGGKTEIAAELSRRARAAHDRSG